MAELASNICILNATSPDDTLGGASVVDILQNEVVSREVLKYLNLTDLKACTLVNQSISYITKCYIRDHIIMDANLPRRSSPCTAFAALESAMDQMDFIHFTGLHIYINNCSAHPADSPLIQKAGDLHPNILSRLVLKRLIIKFRTNSDSTCWMARTLIEKLLDKNAMVLRELSLDLHGGGTGRNSLKLIHGVRIFTKLSKLNLNSCQLDEDNDAPLRTSFYSSLPNLREISSDSLSSFPSTEHFRLVKQYLVSCSNNSTVNSLKRITGDNLKLNFLNIITSNLGRLSIFPWKMRYKNEMEYLMQQSCDSLRTMTIQGDEFPQFSKLNIPPMINLRNLQIVYTLEEPWFLTELGNLCVLLPRVQSVHIYHSPCRETHSSLDTIEDASAIVPNTTASVLRIEGFHMEMDIYMPIFAKYFPNLKELQVYDCDSSAMKYIYLWPQLECLALGGKNSYWNNNFDHVLIGLTGEEMQQWVEGAPVNPISLMAIKSLRRLYFIGGGNGQMLQQSNDLLSPLAMSCLLKKFPNLAVRVLPGYKCSVLSHLVTFDNAHENFWCPPCPFDIQALFNTKAVSFVKQRCLAYF